MDNQQNELINASLKKQKEIQEETRTKAISEKYDNLNKKLATITYDMLLQHAQNTGKRSYVVMSNFYDSCSYMSVYRYLDHLNSSRNFPAKLHWKVTEPEDRDMMSSSKGNIEFRW